MFRSLSPILLEIPFVPRSSRRPRRLEKTKHYPLLSNAFRKPSPICVEGRVESRGDSPFFPVLLERLLQNLTQNACSLSYLSSRQTRKPFYPPYLRQTSTSSTSTPTDTNNKNHQHHPTPSTSTTKPPPPRHRTIQLLNAPSTIPTSQQTTAQHQQHQQSHPPSPPHHTDTINTTNDTKKTPPPRSPHSDGHHDSYRANNNKPTTANNIKQDVPGPASWLLHFSVRQKTNRVGTP